MQPCHRHNPCFTTLIYSLMKKELFILASLLASSLHAQDYTQQRQYNMGKLLPTASVSFVIEYPEYQRLNKTAITSLRKQGFTPSEQVKIDAVRSVSRGETFYDLSFTPIIKKGNQWYEVVNYTIRPIVKNSVSNNAIKNIVLATQTIEKQNRYTETSVLSSGKWVKIRVSKEGIYQLSDAQLKNAGFSNPSKVKLYGYGGQLLPETFNFSDKNALIDDLNEVPLYRREGSSLFFAEGLTTWTSNTKFKTNTFSQYSYYFLTEADDSHSTQPAAFATLPEVSDIKSSVSTVPAHALIHPEETTWYGGGKRFFDSKELQNGVTYKLSLPGNTDAQNTIAYDITSIPVGSTTYFNITCTNDNKSARNYFDKLGDGITARGFVGTLSAALGTEAKFNVSTTQTGHLHYLYTTYTQQLSTLYTTEAFTTSLTGAVELQVSNANANTRVWRLGNAKENVAQLYGTLDNGIYKAQATDATDRFMIVDIAANYSSPEIVGTIENQNLHADKNLDYIIIIPASGKYAEQAQRLATYHEQKSGLRVKVVRADQIYNEFSSGTPDATAYRRYLKMLYDRASTTADMPRYLLLFGACSYDNRMITSEWKKQNPNDFLLAYEKSKTENIVGSYGLGTLNDYVTDDYYGFLDDDEGANILTEKLDLAIGRFPCSTEEEAEILTNNTLKYLANENVGVWKNRMWAIGDVGDENLHMNDAQSVCQQVSTSANDGFLLRKVYPDAYEATHEAKGITYPEATSKIVRAMQTGALIFNYNGHGRPDRLSRTFLIDKDDIAKNTSTSLPLWIFASCEITPYDQNLTDIGRNALFNANGGAIGVICASRSVYANYNASLNRGVVKYSFAKDANQQRNTIAEALRLTKIELNNLSDNKNTIGTDKSENKLKYAYLGDPAVYLTYADQGIYIDSINGNNITANTAIEKLAVGEKITFSGYVNGDENSSSADQTFNGVLYATIFSPIKSITCKGHDNSGSTKPLTYTDYTQTLFDGSVEVKNGRFIIQAIIPQGISFSTNPSLLSLYAVNKEHTAEYNGAFKGFCINHSASEEVTDTLGPKIYMYVDSPDFPDGGTANTSSVLYASIADSTGISMMSGNLGHDMELWFDNKVSESVVVNDYFSFNYGSYNEGLLEYPLSGLDTGTHTATLRVWDVYDNCTTTKLSFTLTSNIASNFDVTIANPASDATARLITSFIGLADDANGTDVTTEVYNIQGMRVWHNSTHVDQGVQYASFDWDKTDYSGSKLPSGVYLYRSLVGNKHTASKKLIIK